MVEDGSPATGTVKIPVPPAAAGSLFGYEPGEVPHSIPRLVTVAPPSAVTLPPSVAVVSVTSANEGDVTVGGDAGVAVVKLFSAEYDVPWEFVAHARK